MSKRSKNKKFTIKKSSNVGSPDAETDDMLFDVFVNIDNCEEILDTRNQKSVLIGRTGTGKSAIIKYLKKECDNLVEIEPEAMSLRFLSNSTILMYFKGLGVNLHLFYKVLWKHVFIVELLKMYFDDGDDERKKNSFFQNLQTKFKSKGKSEVKKERALQYMEGWTNDFWKKTEYRVKSMERSIQSEFAGSLGIPTDLLLAKIASKDIEKDTTIIEAKHKAESIINNSQVEELIEIVRIMKDELFVNHQKKFFIVVDNLDLEWIDDQIRYELIGAMVEVIKEFRQMQGVKIVISLRENLNEIVFSGIKNNGGQREKFKPLYSDMEWSNDDLKSLINKRIRLLSDKQLDIKKAFYESRRDNGTGFDFILDRSFKRPRDIISYVNHAIKNAGNKEYFTKDILVKAESSYSLERFQALEDEWSENFGGIKSICEFLRGINNGFRLKSFREDDFALVYCVDSPKEEFKGDLLNAVLDWKSEKINFVSFFKKIIYILFRMGVVGIKKGPKYKIAFYYDKDVLIDRNDITNSSRFYVHPSLYSYFKVNVLAQLPEDD
jgi:hypothetical protein